MPRLQTGHRTSLLSTRTRNAFLEAFTRQVAPVEGTRIDLGSIARRVQAELRRSTGHYYPLHQVMTSIHDIENYNAPQEHQPARATSLPPSDPVQIVITSSTPAHPSMSRRRMEHNIPALQLHLTIPPPAFQSSANATPTSLTPTGRFPLFPLPRRLSLSTAHSALSPITPIEQIVHTPLTPPKMPRFAPPPPRTWVRLNTQARMGEISPLDSPALPLTPYVLEPTHGAKPVLGRLQIPGTTVPGDQELRDQYMSSSPQAVSPLDFGKIYYNGASARPAALRTNSSSNLTRTALLRATRPTLSRSSSAQGFAEGRLTPSSPLASPAMVPANRQSLASPFVYEGEYFPRF